MNYRLLFSYASAVLTWERGTPKARGKAFHRHTVAKVNSILASIWGLPLRDFTCRARVQINTVIIEFAL